MGVKEVEREATYVAQLLTQDRFLQTLHQHALDAFLRQSALVQLGFELRNLEIGESLVSQQNGSHLSFAQQELEKSTCTVRMRGYKPRPLVWDACALPSNCFVMAAEDEEKNSGALIELCSKGIVLFNKWLYTSSLCVSNRCWH